MVSRCFVILALAVGAAGCAPGAPSEETEDVDAGDAALSQATLTFGAAWNEDMSGVLAEGGKITLAYDDARLAPCKSFQGGTPQYAVTAHARFADGSEQSVTVAGLMAAQSPSFTAPVAGEMQLWFEATNKYGCHQWDSNFGDNYRFIVVEEPSRPDWMGNAAFLLSRQTCNGSPCDSDRRALDRDVPYDTWARQRAAFRSLFFDVWEPGVTDFDNPDLWKQLDAEVHYRWSGQASFQTEYVNFSRRVGNDARYELGLSRFDPLHGDIITDPSMCPAGALSVSADGFYVDTALELYFTVNGKELRPGPGKTYRVVFSDYRERYEPCL